MEILIVSVAVGVPIALVFFLLGLMARRSRKITTGVQPICPCEHSIGEHENLGSCKATWQRRLYSGGYFTGYSWVECACTKYWGPMPITEFFHQGIFVPEVTDEQR